MASNNSRTISRGQELNEKKGLGMPYIVNLSDLRELDSGEKDKPFLAGGGECTSNPKTCGRLIKGNKRCGNVVELKFSCPNVERSG